MDVLEKLKAEARKRDRIVTQSLSSNYAAEHAEVRDLLELAVKEIESMRGEPWSLRWGTQGLPRTTAPFS